MRAAQWDRLSPWLIAAIVPAAAATLILIHRFDGLYGQDPFAYHDYALGPARDSLRELRPLPPFFWPPVYPLLAALASFVVGTTPFAGQLVSLIAGGAIVLFTVLLAREVWEDDPRAHAIAVIAGLVTAFHGQLWQSSTVFMSDTAALALATAGMWQLARYARRPLVARLLLAAALLAAATATRWIYGVVAIPATICAVLLLSRTTVRRAVAHGATAVTAATLLLGPLLLDAFTGSGDGTAAFAGNFDVYTWNPVRALGREFVTVDGLLRHDSSNLAYYGLAPFRWAYFTPLLAPLIVPGAVRLLRLRSAAMNLVVIGWAAAVLLFHLGAAYQNFRFTLAFLPPLALLVGAGWAEVRDLSGRRTRALLVGLLVGGLVLMAGAATHTTRVLIERKNESLDTVRWAERQLPADARLLTIGLTLTFRHYTRVDALDLYEIDGRGVARHLASNRPLFLLVQPEVIEGQWRDARPGANYRRLAAAGLTAIARRDSWRLLRVDAHRAERP